MKRQNNQQNMKRGAKKGHLTNNGLLEDHGFRSSAVALLLKAALIQVSDYRLLGASGFYCF
jgi:hypothetical protein